MKAEKDKWKKGRNDAHGAACPAEEPHADSCLLLMTNTQHHYHLAVLRKQNFPSIRAHKQHVN